MCGMCVLTVLAFAMSLLVFVQIEVRGSCVMPWTIVGVENTTTINELTDIALMSYRQRGSTEPVKLTSVLVGADKKGDFQRISFMSYAGAVGSVVDAFGRYFIVKLEYDNCCDKDVQTPDSPSKLGKQSMNAFSVLMSRKHDVLPSKIPPSTKKQELFNSILDFLAEKKVAFSPENVKIQGKGFVQSLTNILWYIGPHYDSFQGRSCVIPANFEEFMTFNDPVSSKHSVKPVKSQVLLDHAVELDKIALLPWINRHSWSVIRKDIITLAESLHKYVVYLQKKRLESTANNERLEPVRAAKNSENYRVLAARTVSKPQFHQNYSELNDALDSAPPYHVIELDPFTPDDTRKRRHYLDHLHEGIKHTSSLYSYAYGNSLGTYHYIWKHSPCDDTKTITDSNLKIISTLKSQMPVFHTREMRKKFIKTCGSICGPTQPAYLRQLYIEITGDASASESSDQAIIDERVKQAFIMEDFDIVTDLRQHNTGRPPVYEKFFEKCEEYLSNTVEQTCDDRRHDQFTYLASAISVRDLKENVAKMCGPDIPIPSVQWLRLQFAPKIPSSIASLQYTGRLNVRYMVQSRIFRSKHVDDHYCAALFKYLKEFAVKFQDLSTFVAMDDKHYCKVGEPGNPVAAVDRGKRVLVAGGKKMAVSDHDFAKASIVPSVTMIIDIPKDVSSSFYRGQVYVGLKDHVFESSSPIRHAAELRRILLENENGIKPVLLVHTDGGPDHRCNFISVQASLIALFRSLDLDMLIAVRTAPNASWRNPPERVMSLLNLGLNCVGLMREPMEENFEAMLRTCNNMSNIRDKAKAHPELKKAFCDSMEPVKILLSDLFSRLSWKGKQVQIFPAASEDDMCTLYTFLQEVDNTVLLTDRSAKDLKKKEDLQKFIEHCCVCYQYSFMIKKCGMDGCDMCLPPKRLSSEQLQSLFFLPCPVPDEQNPGHYMTFDSVYGNITMGMTEEHRPSASKGNARINPHGIPFSPSAQTSKTVSRTVMCTECSKPRVIYSEKKIDRSGIGILDKIIELYSYTCGCQLQELKRPNTVRVNALLDKVFVRRNLTCSDDVEVPYFSSGIFEDVCIRCATKENLRIEGGLYPTCEVCIAACAAKLKKKRNLHGGRGGKSLGKKVRK